MKQVPGQRAVQQHGWLTAHKWLLLRRISQLSILGLFLLGPWFGWWIVKGNLSSSLILETLPLSEPFVLLQSLFAGHTLAVTALTGAAVVLLFYAVVGGRVYCSWVCPMNMVTDVAAWLRRRLGLKGGAHFSRRLRYWILGMSLILAAITGSLAWELINPVSVLHRGLIFGFSLGWLIVLGIFVLDLLVSRHAWCGHLCPMGAIYNLVGRYSLIRISATRREQCDDCMDCFAICPEQQVISPALKGSDKGTGPRILDANCTNCGRCIDVCSKDVFEFKTRFQNYTYLNVTAIRRSHHEKDNGDRTGNTGCRPGFVDYHGG